MFAASAAVWTALAAPAFGSVIVQPATSPVVVAIGASGRPAAITVVATGFAPERARVRRAVRRRRPERPAVVADGALRPGDVAGPRDRRRLRTRDLPGGRPEPFVPAVRRRESAVAVQLPGARRARAGERAARLHELHVARLDQQHDSDRPIRASWRWRSRRTRWPRTRRPPRRRARRQRRPGRRPRRRTSSRRGGSRRSRSAAIVRTPAPSDLGAGRGRRGAEPTHGINGRAALVLGLARHSRLRCSSSPGSCSSR